MADLDDFFAKKDRKKSKGGKKFTTTEELAKKLEETHRREKEKAKENKKLLSSQNLDDGEPGSERKEEDEWKDFEEEKKDYTNLKIQNLQISETANADNGDGDDDENEMVENEEGVMVSRKKQPSGPWMSVPHAPQAEEPVREEVRPMAPPPTDGGGGGGGIGGKSGYVPPHLRGGNAPSQYAPPTSFSPSPSSGYSSSYSSSMHHQPLSSSRFKSRAAPDITNEAYFPTLSASNTDAPNSAWGRRREDGRGFEEVRNARTNTSTYNPRMAASGQGPNLNLGNKWDALRDQS